MRPSRFTSVLDEGLNKKRYRFLFWLFFMSFLLLSLLLSSAPPPPTIQNSPSAKLAGQCLKRLQRPLSDLSYILKEVGREKKRRGVRDPPWSNKYHMLFLPCDWRPVSVQSRQFFESTLPEQLFELENEETIKNLRTYATYRGPICQHCAWPDSISWDSSFK